MQKKSATWGLILTALLVSEITSAFEFAMVLAALKSLFQHYRPLEVGWVVTSFLLVSAVSAALGGRLGDMFGRRKVLLVMLGSALVGSIISAATTDIHWVICGRAIQGMSGGILPICYGMVRELAPQKKVSSSIGFLSAAAAGGNGVGLILGGWIVDNLNWHFIFVMSAIVAALSLILVLAFIPRGQGSGRAHRIDIPGGLLFAIGISSFLLAVGSFASLWWLLPASFVVLALWIFHELRHPEPMIDVRLFCNRQIMLANICMAMVGLGSIQMTQLIILLLQQPLWTGVGLGISATLAGLMKIPSSLSAIASASASGYLARRISARHLVIVAGILAAMAWAALLVQHDSLSFIVAMTLLISCSMGMVYVALPIVVIDAAPLARTSEAAGVLSVTRATFTSVGAQVMLTFMALSTVSDPTRAAGVYPSAFAYELVFGFILSTAVLIIVAGSLLRDAPPPQAGDGTNPQAAQE